MSDACAPTNLLLHTTESRQPPPQAMPTTRLHMRHLHCLLPDDAGICRCTKTRTFNSVYRCACGTSHPPEDCWSSLQGSQGCQTTTMKTGKRSTHPAHFPRHRGISTAASIPKAHLPPCRRTATCRRTRKLISMISACVRCCFRLLIQNLFPERDRASNERGPAQGELYTTKTTSVMRCS